MGSAGSTMASVDKIISGGQSGVDQAALFVATELDIPIGGWCPLRGLDENGESILEKYPLVEVTGLSFDDSVTERTKRNIESSDGTLIIVPSIPIQNNISDGTMLTIEYSREKQKPYLLISCVEDNAVEFSNWLREYRVKILNVAGPRESSCIGIYDQTCQILLRLLRPIKSEKDI